MCTERKLLLFLLFTDDERKTKKGITPDALRQAKGVTDDKTWELSLEHSCCNTLTIPDKWDLNQEENKRNLLLYWLNRSNNCIRFV